MHARGNRRGRGLGEESKFDRDIIGKEKGRGEEGEIVKGKCSGRDKHMDGSKSKWVGQGRLGDS